MGSDEDAMRDLFDASYRRLVGQLIGVTGSRAEAEDAVQEAFVRALRHRRTVLNADNPEAWLRRAAGNVARSRWRRAQRFLHLMPALVERTTQEDLSPDSVALLEAMKDLPDVQREAVALHHLADLSVHEVSQQLGVPEGTIKARLTRGRARLAVSLGEAEADVDQAAGPTDPGTDTDGVAAHHG